MKNETSINLKEIKRIKFFKFCVWLALFFYAVIILGSFASVYNDNHHNDSPSVFQSTSPHYDSETAITVTALLHNYSDDIEEAKSYKIVLCLYLGFLTSSYFLAYWSALKFLSTFDKSDIRITVESSKYLRILSEALIGIYIILFLTVPIYTGIAVDSPEFIYFEFSQLGDVSITLLLTALFLRILATILKHSAELQEEVDGTI